MMMRHQFATTSLRLLLLALTVSGKPEPVSLHDLYLSLMLLLISKFNRYLSCLLQLLSRELLGGQRCLESRRARNILCRLYRDIW